MTPAPPLQRRYRLSLLFTAWLLPVMTGAGQAPVETHAYLGPCVFRASAPDRSIGGALAGGLLDVGLQRLGRALAAAGTERTTTIAAQRNFHASNGGRIACLQLVRGGFGATNASGVRPDDGLGDSLLGRYTKELEQAGIRLRAPPDLFVELEIRPSDDGSAYALAPTFLSYARSLDSKRQRSRLRFLAIEARLHPPGVGAHDRGSSGGVVVLGLVSPGSEVLYAGNGDPSGVPAPESAWIPAVARPEATPWTLTLSATETQEDEPFMLFLADVLDESENDLADALHEQWLAQRQAVLDGYDRRSAAAEALLKDYCTGDYGNSATEALDRSAAAHAAQRIANRAARMADLPEPYAELVEISDRRPAAGAITGC